MSDTLSAVEAVAVVRRARRRTTRRGRTVAGALALALLGAFAARTLLGDYLVTVPDFWRIVGGVQIPGASFILIESKLPRAVVGALAGVAFGLGGAIFQAVLRNPLASPDLIGISAGASAGAVVAIIPLGLTGAWVPCFAIGGALGVGAAIAACAGPRAGARLVLVGVAFTAALVSVVQYLFTRASVFQAQDALVWLTGSLNQVGWPAIRLFLPALVVLLAATVVLAPSLRASELGEDASAALGVPPRRMLPLLAVAVLLVATATAVTGPISFVALLAPPIARRLNRGRVTLVGAALLGGLVVVAGDYAAAYAIPDTNLPVGVVTGAIGAPVLLWLLTFDARGRSNA